MHHEAIDISKRAYTLREFRQAGGPCRSTCYQLIGAGKLRAVKSGRITLITAAEVERFFAELPEMAAAVLSLP